MRRSGRTTKLIDQAIQEVLGYGRAVLIDHLNGKGECYGDTHHRRMAEVVRARLYREHNISGTEVEISSWGGFGYEVRIPARIKQLAGRLPKWAANWKLLSANRAKSKGWTVDGEVLSHIFRDKVSAAELVTSRLRQFDPDSYVKGCDPYDDKKIFKTYGVMLRETNRQEDMMKDNGSVLIEEVTSEEADKIKEFAVTLVKKRQLSLDCILATLPKKAYVNKFGEPHLVHNRHATSTGFTKMLTTKQETERISAIHLLMNVATALNGGYYIPTMGEHCWEIQYNSGLAEASHVTNCRGGVAYFKTEELTKTAIKALGWEIIRRALVGD